MQRCQNERQQKTERKSPSTHHGPFSPKTTVPLQEVDPISLDSADRRRLLRLLRRLLEGPIGSTVARAAQQSANTSAKCSQEAALMNETFLLSFTFLPARDRVVVVVVVVVVLSCRKVETERPRRANERRERGEEEDTRS